MKTLKYIFKTKYLIFFLSVLAVSLFWGLEANAVDFYRINPGQTIEIDEWGVCKRVFNPFGRPAIFVPVKTSVEWREFRLHRPVYVTLDDCVPPAPTLSVSLSALPSSGVAPLNNVDLRANVGGTAAGSIRYRFDCTNDGTWEKDITTTADPYTAWNICHYSTAGTYTARVRVDRQGQTATDTVMITVTTPSSPPPYIPHPSCVAPTDSQITIWWHDVWLEDGYRIYRCRGVACTNFIYVHTTEANVRRWTNTGLAADTYYRFQLRAFNEHGLSGPSNISTCKTTPVPTYFLFDTRWQTTGVIGGRQKKGTATFS